MTTVATANSLSQVRKQREACAFTNQPGRAPCHTPARVKISCAIQGLLAEVVVEAKAWATVGDLTEYLQAHGFLNSMLPSSSWAVLQVRRGRYLGARTRLDCSQIGNGEFLYWRRPDLGAACMGDNRVGASASVSEIEQEQ